MGTRNGPVPKPECQHQDGVNTKLGADAKRVRGQPGAPHELTPPPGATALMLQPWGRHKEPGEGESAGGAGPGGRTAFRRETDQQIYLAVLENESCILGAWS